MKNVILLFFISILFYGCVQKNKYMGIVKTSNTQNDYNLIYTLSKQCFEQGQGLFSDGIYVHSNINNSTITFHRYASDIGTTKPFVILHFEDNQIDIHEGPHNIGITGYQKFNVKTHIERWLQGDTTCKN